MGRTNADLKRCVIDYMNEILVGSNKYQEFDNIHEYFSRYKASLKANKIKGSPFLSEQQMKCFAHLYSQFQIKKNFIIYGENCSGKELITSYLTNLNKKKTLVVKKQID